MTMKTKDSIQYTLPQNPNTENRVFWKKWKMGSDGSGSFILIRYMRELRTEQKIRHSAKNNCPVSSDQGTECTVSVYPQDISGGFISYRVPNRSFLEKHTAVQTTDFYHAGEYIGSAGNAAME